MSSGYEVEDELSNLYNTLDNRDQTIKELEKQLSTILDTTDPRHGSDQHPILLSELERTRMEIVQQRQVISELEEQVGHDMEQINTAKAELKNSRDQIKVKDAIIESQGTKLRESEESKEVLLREIKVGKGDLYRLERETSRLQELLLELEGNEENLVMEVGQLANERYSLDLKHQQNTREAEELNLLLDEKSNYAKKCEYENFLLLEKIDGLDKKEMNTILKMEELETEHTLKLEELKQELEKERCKTKTNITSKFSSSLGEEQRSQITKLKADFNVIKARAEKFEAENKMMKRDLDSACCALQEARFEKAESLLEIESKQERMVCRLREQVEELNLKAGEMKRSHDDLQLELDRLKEQLRAAEKRNSWYERGNGLEDLILSQKKLELDIRCREVDRRKLLIKIGQKDDHIALMTKRCELLESEDSEIVDIACDETKMKEAIDAQESSLRAQNKELCQQINSLEDERNKLLKRLRTNAAAVGDNYPQFLGLSSTQMEKVIEFACNVKDGSMHLPIDDKSAKLSAKLAAIQILRQSDLCTIDRLEREIESFKITNSLDGNIMVSELGEALNKIQHQNHTLQEELKSIIKTKQDDCDDCNDESKVVKLSCSDREKLEKIIGECIRSTITPSQISAVIREHERLEDELNTAWKREQKISNIAPDIEINKALITEKRNLELKMQRDEREMKRCQCRLSKLEGELLEQEKDDLAHKFVSKRSVQVQVDIDRCTVRGKNSTIRLIKAEWQCTKDLLLASERKLLTCQSKIKILQNTLTRQSMFEDDKERISKAHSALKTLLDEKNKLIAKYREKDVAKKKMNRTTTTPRCNESKSNMIVSSTQEGTSSTVASLLKKLEDTSSAVAEKELIIQQMRRQVQDEQGKLKLSAVQHSHISEALEQYKDRTEILSSERDGLRQIVENECDNNSYQVNNLKNQISLRDERLDCLSNSLKRMKTALRTSNEVKCKLAAVEADLRRTKSELNAARRSKDNSKKTLEMSKQRHAEALKDIERLQKEGNRLQKQAINMKQEKSILEKRNQKANVKIRELHASANTFYDESKIQSIEDDYKVIISNLKKENIRLRGSVASIKLKQGEEVIYKNSNFDSISKSKGDTFRVLKAEKNSREQMNQELRDEHNKLRKVIVEKEERIVNLESKVLAYHQSPSNMESSRHKINILKSTKEALQDEEISSHNIEQETPSRQMNVKEMSILKKQFSQLQESQACSEAENLRLEKALNEMSNENLLLLHEPNRLKIQISQLQEIKAKSEAENMRLETALREKTDESHLLRGELGSFDLEFFEQLEDLKYNYNQAKLNGYVAG